MQQFSFMNVILDFQIISFYFLNIIPKTECLLISPSLINSFFFNAPCYVYLRHFSFINVII